MMAEIIVFYSFSSGSQDFWAGLLIGVMGICSLFDYLILLFLKFVPMLSF